MSFGGERYIIKRSIAIYRMVDRPAPTDAGADPPHLRLRCSDLTCRGSNFLDTHSRNLRLLLLQLRQVSFGSERYIAVDRLAIYRIVDRLAPMDAGASGPG